MKQEQLTAIKGIITPAKAPKGGFWAFPPGKAWQQDVDGFLKGKKKRLNGYDSKLPRMQHDWRQKSDEK